MSASRLPNDLPLDLDLEAAGELGDAEARIGRQAGGDHLRLGDAEFVEGGLETAIAEQRDLHRAIGGQWLAQELIDPRFRRECYPVVADLHHILAEIGVSRGLDRCHPAIGREAGAAAKQCCRRGEQAPAQQAAGIRLGPGEQDRPFK
jgi:hypothetical protein